MARRTTKTTDNAASKGKNATSGAAAKPSSPAAKAKSDDIIDAEIVEPAPTDSAKTDAKAEPAKPDAKPAQAKAESSSKAATNTKPAAAAPKAEETAADKGTQDTKAAADAKSPKSTETPKATGSGSGSGSGTTPPPPTPPTPPQAGGRKGVGIPTVIGVAVIAAGLAYGAGAIGLLPSGTSGPANDNSEETAALQAALAQQAEALAALQGQIESLSQPAAPPPAPEIDLSPVTDQIGSIANRVDATGSTIETLVDRIAVLEDRPIFTGELGDDAAEAAEALAAMEAQLAAQREESERLAAEIAAATAEADAALAEAEAAQAAAAAAIAEAEAQAAATMARANAEAALNALRVAMEDGSPYAEDLAIIAEATEIPEALSAAAETGVPTLEAIQDGFGPAARAALPIALRETADDSTVGRIGAFLQGQVGGRSLEPREGDDPDAILSRMQGAVNAGDLTTALAEMAALSEGAQAELATWAAAAQTRAAALDAVAAVTQAVSGAN